MSVNSAALAKPHRQHPFAPEMVPIPAGPFLMGSSDQQIEQLAQQWELARKWREKGRFRREQPQHCVALPAYEIARHAVTVAQYRPFVEAGGYLQRRYWSEAGWAWRRPADVTRPLYWDEVRWSGDDRLPVVGVSWYEAYAYCRWLSEVTGHGYRLPTEAEWEKAARGTDGRTYPWGDAFEPARCNTRASGLERTTPVRQCQPAGDSPFGCAGMAGNASQWTQSQFRPYPYTADDGREAPEGEALRVIRGGSWFKDALRARTSARGMNDPFFRDNDVGFRCARSS